MIMKKTHILAIVALALAAITPAQAQTTKELKLYTMGNTLAVEKITSQTSAVAISRYLFAGYNSICLPFDMTVEEVKAAAGDDVQLERMARVDNGELYFLDCTSEGIQAGKPYLIYVPTTKSVYFRTSNLSNLQQAPIPVTMGGVTMSGEWNKTTDEHLMGIPALQETDLLQAILIRTGGEKNFYPTRCSFATDAAEVPVIKHVTSLEDQTSIQQLIDQDARVNVYLPNGTLVQRNIRMSKAMSTLPSGMYVTNGQKFIVK